ncbi:MAG: sigma-54-dependent transcriptional regulator [Desulfatirhabdiaceae bacterium]
MNQTKPAILVVDDDRAHRTMLKTLISSWGYDMSEADDGSEAISCVRQRAYDLILMDIRMVNVSGLEALEQIKSFNPAIPVVIMTAYSSVETAINALKSGAYDYLIKPLDFTKLKITINRAMEHAVLKNENLSLRQSLASCFDRRNIVGNSPAMEKLLDTVAQVAPSEATILINGESGTGKELIAGALHYNSHRKSGPFIKINCAAITETLLESELFGHEKGAFTGAERRKEGRFVQAAGGSLFLDEVSEMSLMMQVKLLRVLQERELTRVGGEQVIPVDVRVVAAANRLLPPLIAQGKFREDLYYRLNVVNLTIPPLRERREDIPLLAQHFVEKFAAVNRKTIRGFTPRTMDHLIRYDWPGNVRELMNTVERAVVLARSDFLDDSELPILPSNPDETVDSSANHPNFVPDMPLVAVEKAAIIRTLESTGGNKSQAARLLGITRKTLHSKLRSFGIISKG